MMPFQKSVLVKKMPINVFGNTSNNSKKRTDTSLFVQKPYLRNENLHIESHKKIDRDIKNQYRIRNLPDYLNNKEAAAKNMLITNLMIQYNKKHH